MSAFMGGMRVGVFLTHVWCNSFQVYEWDMRTGGCIDKFQDAACLRLSALAASPAVCAAHDYHPSALLATGKLYRGPFVSLSRLCITVAYAVGREIVRRCANKL